MAGLTEAQRQRLLSFAQRRLRRLLTTPWAQRLLAITSPEDILEETYRKVLSRERDPRDGRALPASSLRSIPTFIHGLESIINSEVSNWVNLAEITFLHEELDMQNDDGGCVVLADPDWPRTLMRRDLHRVLFARLRRKAAAEPGLLPILDYWEPRFLDADRIAGPEFDKNLVQRVRQLARKVLWELATEAEPHAVDGRDMLL